MSRAHAAGARLREGKGFSRAGAGRDSVGSRMCSGRGTAKIWTRAALQREMSTTGRGSPAAQGGRAHLRQALIQLRGESPGSSRASSQAQVTQSKGDERTSSRDEGTPPAGPVPGAGGSCEGQGLAEQRWPPPCPASRPSLCPAQVCSSLCIPTAQPDIYRGKFYSCCK